MNQLFHYFTKRILLSLKGLTNRRCFQRFITRLKGIPFFFPVSFPKFIRSTFCNPLLGGWGCLPGLGDVWEFLLRSRACRGNYWPVPPFRPRPQAAPWPQHGGHTPFLGELSERNLGPEPPPAREGMEGSARAGRRSRRGWGYFRRFGGEGRSDPGERDPRTSLPELEMKSLSGLQRALRGKHDDSAPVFPRYIPVVNLSLLKKYCCKHSIKSNVWFNFHFGKYLEQCFLHFFSGAFYFTFKIHQWIYICVKIYKSYRKYSPLLIFSLFLF